MTKIKIGEREIEIKRYTRGIQKRVSDKMLEGVTMSASGEMSPVPAINGDKSEQYLVELMSGLSMEELDDLDTADYDRLKDAVNKVVQGEKKADTKKN